MEARPYYQGAPEDEIRHELAALPPAFLAVLDQFIDQFHPSFPEIFCSRVTPFGSFLPKDSNGALYLADIYNLTERGRGVSDYCCIDVQLLKTVYDNGGRDEVLHFIWAELTAHCEGIEEFIAEHDRAKHARH